MNSYKNIITIFKLTTRTGRKPFGINESKQYDNLNDVDQDITWFEQVWQKGESWTVEVMQLSAGKPKDKWVTIDYSSY
tara:strand:- start:2083 stop:2316 length:234 start_codon:yes stop_codon:yes gene_type:complete